MSGPLVFDIQLILEQDHNVHSSLSNKVTSTNIKDERSDQSYQQSFCGSSKRVYLEYYYLLRRQDEKVPYELIRNLGISICFSTYLRVTIFLFWYIVYVDIDKQFFSCNLICLIEKCHFRLKLILETCTLYPLLSDWYEKYKTFGTMSFFVELTCFIAFLQIYCVVLNINQRI